MQALKILFEEGKLDKEHIAFCAKEMVSLMMERGDNMALTIALLKGGIELNTLVIKDPDFQNMYNSWIETYDNNKTTYKGIKFAQSNGASVYDFSGDLQYQELAVASEKMATRLKVRADFLKAVYESNAKIANMDGGEEITVKKISTGSVSPKITFPK